VCQLRVPVELHTAGPVGHRLRDGGREHPADDPTEQESLSGPPGWLPGRIVSAVRGVCMTIT
jgi:hypothetical protein